MKNLHLIDGNSCLFNAYHAYGNKTDSKGRPTAAIYGFTKFLIEVIKEKQPEYLAVVFRTISGSVSYPDLPDQFLAVKEIAKAFRVPVFESRSHEVSEMMPAIAAAASNAGANTLYLSKGKHEPIPVENTQLQVQFSLSDCRVKPPDIKAISQIFRDFELLNLLSDLRKSNQPSQNYHTILSQDHLNKLSQYLGRLKEFSIDTETTGVDPMRAELVGISIAWQPGYGAYIPVGHKYLDAPTQLSIETVKNTLAPVLENTSIAKIGQNIKYDLIVLRRHGFNIKGVAFDTMVASYLINPGGGHHNLNDMALKHLDHKAIPIGKLLGERPFRMNMSQARIEEVASYACEDADLTLRLKHCLEPLLEKKGLTRLLKQVEMPLLEILTDMELTGVEIDRAQLEELSGNIEKETAQIAKNVYETAGCEFNINSHQQLGEVLFEKLKLPVSKKTKTGYSTKDKVLTKLADKHDAVRLVLEYRSLASIKTSHVDSLLTLINPKTRRLHTSFNQARAQTGRLTSSSPNLQNVPLHSSTGALIRKAFVAKADCVFLSADYSQIELRILAHICGDEKLIDSFIRQKDVHKETASKVFGVKVEDVTPQMRQRAKAVNFAIIYGMTPQGLSDELKIELSQALDFIKAYFDNYPKVKSFIDSSIQQAKTKGYVNTLLGRIRPLPHINSLKEGVREMAKREAVNTPIQGSAADLIKVAMISIDNTLKTNRLHGKIILQIHDELLLEVPQEELEETEQIVKSCMEGAFKLKVPIKVNISTGYNWKEITK